MTVQPIETDDIDLKSHSQLEAFAHNYALGQAAIEELEKLKPILALAISKLPKQQLKVSLTDMAEFGTIDMQMKMESKSGAILFRAVQTFDR